MKRLAILAPALLSASLCWAETDRPDRLEINGVDFDVPADSAVTRRDSLIKIEEFKDYAARKIHELEARVDQLSDEQRQTRREIKELRELIGGN